MPVTEAYRRRLEQAKKERTANALSKPAAKSSPRTPPAKLDPRTTTYKDPETGKRGGPPKKAPRVTQSKSKDLSLDAQRMERLAKQKLAQGDAKGAQQLRLIAKKNLNRIAGLNKGGVTRKK